ncbi:MAG: fumarate hydratase, class II [Chlamydiae bacterium RIFCSPHIGHO2_12_FULL_49_11]|nr:MAG: fumarate hydratase, class II [Chlamydiae bacterium RIFCSPHIGHO2_12_FULL_49_11]
MGYREEEDTLGKVKVPEDKFWGAQTQRSLENFAVSNELMPIEVIHALALIKKHAAHVNADLGLLPEEKQALIAKAAEEIVAGRYDAHFPLTVWQTGSGTQTNMNVNEVIANIANVLAGTSLGAKAPIHPNDDVNRSQSSNDVIPSAIALAVTSLVHRKLIPALSDFIKMVEKKMKEFKGVVKCGRTHLMDATPLTLAQEFSAYAGSLSDAKEHIEAALKQTVRLALGGTAVGTGFTAHPDFGARVCMRLDEELKLPFTASGNKFAALSTLDSILPLSSALRFLAGALYKMASDIRLLASGPRCGIGELNLPANEPGSSIMPGKVNPTQCESLTQVALQVMGFDAVVAMASTQGHLQLNVYRPIVAYNTIRSIHLLADSLVNFSHRCLKGITPNLKKIHAHLENSLMLVTALSSHIGYERSARIAKLAHEKGITLKAATLELGLLTAEEFDRYVVPESMT